jgi:molecular chaperone DnaK
MAADNTSLGRFTLEGILPAPRGMPQIEVTFDIDANGIINVSAKDKGTGKEQKITIASSNKLSKDEIEDLVRQAEKFADADKKKVEYIDAKNQAETMIHSVRKSLEELGEKVSQEERASVEAATSDLENAIKGDDAGAIKSKLEALMKAMGPISQRIYQEAAAQQQDSGQTDGDSASGDEFVDADYKIVDDDEKK